MTIVLNHTIVAAKNKRDAARGFAGIFGLPFDEASTRHFAPVQINETLTLLFDDERNFPHGHYAFHVPSMSATRRSTRFLGGDRRAA